MVAKARPVESTAEARARRAGAAAVVLAVLAGQGFSLAAPDDALALKLVAVPESTELRLEQELIVTLWLEARGRLWLPTFLDEESNVEIIVIGPDGRKVPRKVGHARLKPLARESYMRLEPGYRFGRELVVADEHFADPGVYRVRFLFFWHDSGEQAGVNAWNGDVLSEELEVTVRGP